MKSEAKSRKLKILYLVQLPPPVHGVSIMNQIAINNCLINEKYSTEIVELKFSNEFSGIRKYNFKKVISFLKVYFELKRKLKVFSPDLVYFSFIPVGVGFFRDFLYLSLIKHHKNKIILHIHNRGIAERSRNLIYRKLYKLVFNNVSVIHVSKRLMEEEFKHLLLKNCKRYFLNNTSNPFEVQHRERNDNQINILFLSNLLPEKGIGIALEAFSLLAEKYSNVRLHIYGQTFRIRYEKKIIRSVEIKGLTDKVHFHGPADTETKKKAFSRADIYIFPSYFKEECMPISILEAMQAGLPIIASAIGAIPDMIDNGINGVLIKPYDAIELFEKLSFLIENRECCGKFGIEAKGTYNRQYTNNVFNINHSNLIKRILSI
jgi:glycosyltransferase involved in cell wall biosynthesis